MARYALTNFSDGPELARNVAGLWVEFIESRREQRMCAVALSGGRISTALYQAFVDRARVRNLVMSNVHFFWADERCVPPDHVDSNYRGAEVHLFTPLGIPAEQIHRIKGELPPQAAAAEAGADVRATVTGAPLPQLDLVILGMGEDGHVASLFPDGRQCLTPTDVYCAVKGPKPPPDRITLSYAMIAAAREVWVIVSGSGKENALRESLRAGGITPLARVLQARSSSALFVEGQILPS